MLKKTVLIALVGALAAMPTLAQTNVGIVDFDVVVQKSEKGKAFFADLISLQERHAAELRVLADARREKQKDAQARAASLSESQKNALRLELLQMETEYKRRKEDLEQELGRQQQSGMDTFERQLIPLVRQLALEKQLQLILSVLNSGIVFFDETIDITNDVIKKYDALQE